MSEENFTVFTAKKTFDTSLGTIRVYSKSDGMTIGSAENEIDALLDALKYKEQRQRYYQNKYNNLLKRLETAQLVLLEEVNEHCDCKEY
jgi:hypothetical protein